MDKKKVRKLLEDSDICFLGYERNGCRDLIQMGLEKLHEAQKELSKSDWVSVEEGLPEYGEEVLVTSKELPKAVWKSFRQNVVIEDEDSLRYFDDNGFATHRCNILVGLDWIVEKLDKIK